MFLQEENPLDSEEEFSDEESPTLSLGFWDKDQKTGKGKKKEGENVEHETGEGGPEKLHHIYWEVVHEAQKKISKANPDMKPKEVLAKAREACPGCTTHLNSLNDSMIMELN